jgi:glutathione synthase/RimK-type ligase-like ATP-grasp enzyme
VILVSGVLGDGMIELMCARLNSMGYAYVFLDELRFPGDFNITWSAGVDGVTGYVSSPSGRVNLRDITGIYARYARYRGRKRADGISDREEELIKSEYELSLMHLFDVMPSVVVNRVRASLSNDSKLYQQLLLASFGFRTPRTLVTTVPEEAAAFYEACGKKVIYKSLSGVRSIVRRLEEEDLPRLELVRNCPAQFQEVVEGVDVRVHTVDDKVFATELISPASDYRYAADTGHSLTARAIDLPPDVASACLQLARRAGLMVSGIDLRRTLDGQHYCFEINPSPGFLFYERATGQPISEAVARLLQAGVPPFAPGNA